MGSANVTTASWHHQSIDQIALGLEIVGEASDGVIEAVAGQPLTHRGAMASRLVSWLYGVGLLSFAVIALSGHVASLLLLSF